MVDRGTLDAVSVRDISRSVREGNGGFMYVRWRAVSLAALVAVSFVLGGCGESVLAPESPSSGGGTTTTATAPPLATFSVDGTMEYLADTLSSDSLIELPLSTKTVTVSAEIDGEKGGALLCGRYSLKVPSGAFKGLGVITMTMRDSTVMVCNLSISPVSLNNFNTPVELTADLSSTNMLDASGCTNYWYDPTRTLWVSLIAKSRCSGSLITTTLDHFSTYGSGKAGW